MTKTTKVVVGIGCAVTLLGSCCALSLLAVAMSPEEETSSATAPALPQAPLPEPQQPPADPNGPPGERDDLDAPSEPLSDTEEAPGGPEEPLADTPEATSGHDGRYACLVLHIMVGVGGAVSVQWNPAVLPPFTVSGTSYETATGRGTVEWTPGVATFAGGPYDGWRGAVGTDGSGPFVLFRGKDHHLVRTDGAKHGDFKCYRQRD